MFKSPVASSDLCDALLQHNLCLHCELVLSQLDSCSVAYLKERQPISSVFAMTPSSLHLQQLWVHPLQTLLHVCHKCWSSCCCIGKGMQGPDQAHSKAAPPALIVPCMWYTWAITHHICYR